MVKKSAQVPKKTDTPVEVKKGKKKENRKRKEDRKRKEERGQKEDGQTEKTDGQKWKAKETTVHITACSIWVCVCESVVMVTMAWECLLALMSVIKLTSLSPAESVSCAVLQLFRVPESELPNKASLWQHHNCYQSNDVILSITRPL